MATILLNQFLFYGKVWLCKEKKSVFQLNLFSALFFEPSYVIFVMATFLSYPLPVFLDRNWRTQQDFNYINLFAFVETDLIKLCNYD